MQFVYRVSKFEAPGPVFRCHFMNQWIIDDENRLTPRNIFWVAIIPAYYRMRSDDVSDIFQIRSTDLVHILLVAFYNVSTQHAMIKQFIVNGPPVKFAKLEKTLLRKFKLECGFGITAIPIGTCAKLERVSNDGDNVSLYITYGCFEKRYISIACVNADPALTLCSRQFSEDVARVTGNEYKCVDDKDAFAASVFAMMVMACEGFIEL